MGWRAGLQHSEATSRSLADQHSGAASSVRTKSAASAEYQPETLAPLEAPAFQVGLQQQQQEQQGAVAATASGLH